MDHVSTAAARILSEAVNSKSRRGEPSPTGPTYFIGLSISVVVAALVFVFFILPVYRLYSRKNDRLDQLEGHYERLRSVRKDVIFHYHWAVERKDWKVS